MELMFLVGSLVVPIRVGAPIGLTKAALPVEHIAVTAVRWHDRRHHSRERCHDAACQRPRIVGGCPFRLGHPARYPDQHVADGSHIRRRGKRWSMPISGLMIMLAAPRSRAEGLSLLSGDGRPIDP